MSSDSEMSSNFASSDPEEEDFVDYEDEDIAVVYGRRTPYQDEPLKTTRKKMVKGKKLIWMGLRQQCCSQDMREKFP